MNKNTDRRTLRTRKALKNAMFELLKKKDITKITVSELTELADIGRGTFYIHYADPYDLLDQIENEMLEKLVFIATSVGDIPFTESWRYSHLLGHLEQVWQYIYENQEYFRILMSHQNGVGFLLKFRKYSENIALNVISREQYNIEDSYSIMYVVSGTIGIFQKWMEDGLNVHPSQLAQMTRNIISNSDSET